uniref:Uncharacterized protein n=1 Tax=Panagrellus redivivus TaxID=6233 RepID=A0A7E4VJB7_PANRE
MRSVEYSKGLLSPGSSMRLARIDNKTKPGIARLFNASLLEGFPNMLCHEPNLVLWMGRVQSNFWGAGAATSHLVTIFTWWL